MENIKLNVKSGVAMVILNRPPANALSTSLLQELANVLDEVENNEEVKVILLCGEGRFFAAGADIKEFTTVEDGKAFQALARNGQVLFERIEGFSKPIICAIHGAALGGGLELAMACHIRLATEDAKLGLPELQLGLIPGFAGSQRLPRFVGQAKACEMMLTSEPITGKEAHQFGLVNHVYPDVDSLQEAAMALASKLVHKSGHAMKLALELLTYAKDDRYHDGVKKEAELFGIAFDSYDGKEGINAFIEKRKPVFKDK